MVLELPLQLPQFALTGAARHPKFDRNRDGMAQPIVGISSLTRLAPRFTRPFNASESAFGTSDKAAHERMAVVVAQAATARPVGDRCTAVSFRVVLGCVRPRL